MTASNALITSEYRIKMANVFTELKIQISQGEGTKHDMLSDELLKNEHRHRYERFNELCWWHTELDEGRLVDQYSLDRIKTVIDISSQFFVYIEDLSYQELLAFKSFVAE